jgi:hypothetical protein
MGHRNVVKCTALYGRALEPGYLTGQVCVECGEELQISPDGLTKVQAGGEPMCATCTDRWLRAQLDRGATVRLATRHDLSKARGA